METAAVCKERRMFNVHPAILKNLITEQASTLSKAFVELIMNAIDAGATKVDLTLDVKGHFVLQDDGKGFRSREEIEAFFETFGTPHTKGDAVYGRFRIGRGQIMAYAKTEWRSGLYEMHVDFQDQESHGYDLIVHQYMAKGCRITGQLYVGSGNWVKGIQEILDRDGKLKNTLFATAIKYVTTPIFLNGIQINESIESANWTMENEVAYFKFEKNNPVLQIYNLGVLVDEEPATKFGTGGKINSKQSLMLNMARNSIMTYQCPVWKEITDTLISRFALSLTKIKKLNDSEATALLANLMNPDYLLTDKLIQVIRKIKFIPDIFGELRTPEEMFSGTKFTVFDDRHTAIAERVQTDKLAVVLTPQFYFFNGDQSVDSDEMAEYVLKKIAKRLNFRTYQYEILCFQDFVDRLYNISQFVDDKELNPEEFLILRQLRRYNPQIGATAGHLRQALRKIVVGNSDIFSGWTDGMSYIAINKKELLKIRQTSGITKLVGILLHEYIHDAATAGAHDHNFHFYKSYHDAIQNAGPVIDSIFTSYIKGLTKLKKLPCGPHTQYLNKLKECIDVLPKRKVTYWGGYDEYGNSLRIDPPND